MLVTYSYVFELKPRTSVALREPSTTAAFEGVTDDAPPHPEQIASATTAQAYLICRTSLAQAVRFAFRRTSSPAREHRLTRRGLVLRYFFAATTPSGRSKLPENVASGEPPAGYLNA